MRAFDLYEPRSIEEACSLLAQFDDQAAVLAGGTDLLVELKTGIINLAYLVNLKKIPELDYITFDREKGLKIGALVTWTELLESELIATHYPVLIKAGEVMASSQIRNIATLAGNICHASPAANGPVVLLLYEAECLIQGPNGRRTIPMTHLFEDVQRNSLQKGEILIEINLPPPPPASGGTYYKFSARRAMDLAVVGVGALTVVDRGIFELVRIALGAVAPVPIRSTKAEDFLTGKKMEDNTIREAARLTAASCNPISDIRASKEYRLELVKELTFRAIKESASGSHR